MSQSDVQALVNLLSNNQSDTTLFALFYADVMNTLGAKAWHTAAATLNYAEGQGTVSLPASLLDLLAVTYDGACLSPVNLRELEALNPDWRSARGTPVAFTRESETVKTLEVHPTPDSAANSPYETAIYSETRTDALPYLTLPIALLVLARDYMRESPYQDLAFASLCNELGQLLLTLLEKIPAPGETGE